MLETWRWYGPRDPIPLTHVVQAGATGIVTALHDVPAGQAWPEDAILERRSLIEAARLEWSVVESIPMPDAIKRDGTAARREIEAWKISLARIGKAGIRTVCYNFMPVVDWTRTDLSYQLPSGGTALRYDHTDFVAYDVGILKRPGAEADYPAEVVSAGLTRLARMDDDQRQRLESNIIAGLPGGAERQTRETIAEIIATFRGLTDADMRQNLCDFLREVVPVAQENGVLLAIHPDDPPRRLFGLPRVVSTQEDARSILKAVDAPENGLTFCTGSYGARAGNDLVGMAEEFATRVNFAHLRMVRLEGNDNFHEAEHLHRLPEVIGVVSALRAGERAQGRDIPLRPDHGHHLATDFDRPSNPGYSYIGRLKGLAELRGLIAGLDHAENRIIAE